MGYKPTTIHIAAMVDELEDGPLRAVYMVVRQLYELQMALGQNNTNLTGLQQIFAIEKEEFHVGQRNDA